MVAAIQTSLLNFESRAVSPLREMGAYEYLWAQKGATFKTLANLFRQHPDCTPSELVEQEDAEQYARLAMEKIENAGVKQFGVRVHGAGEYPSKLRHADDPCELLYFRGDWDLTSSRCVAIVGTRNATPEGKSRAAKLSKSFVERGFTVVSGLAQGIDSVAHKVAIAEGGRTIAVIGTPITAFYPRENRELQEEIATKHLLISQVPIIRYSRQGIHGNRLFFPERNITMSAITEATVIVEASNTSGTLVQARHALKQNRKLFILNSCFLNNEITWPRKFEEKGAVRVENFEQIIERLNDGEQKGAAEAVLED